MLIETNRLRLIPVTRYLWTHVMEDKNGEKFTLNSEWPTQDIKSLISMYLDDLDENPELLGWAFWVITLKNNGLIVGDGGFKGIPDENGEIEIGYGITHSYQNQGYATEAAQGLIQWGFSHKNAVKIKADCLLENKTINKSP